MRDNAIKAKVLAGKRRCAKRSRRFSDRHR